jgi:hypothetical protein
VIFCLCVTNVRIAVKLRYTWLNQWREIRNDKIRFLSKTFGIFGKPRPKLTPNHSGCKGTQGSAAGLTAWSIGMLCYTSNGKAFNGCLKMPSLPKVTCSYNRTRPSLWFIHQAAAIIN